MHHLRMVKNDACKINQSPQNLTISKKPRPTNSKLFSIIYLHSPSGTANTRLINPFTFSSSIAMSEASGHEKNRRGYRRLLSQKFSFNFTEKSKAKAATTKTKTSNHKDIKAHPVIKILEAPSKEAMAKPEFLRYLEYLREAGTWDPNSGRPLIYFK